MKNVMTKAWEIARKGQIKFGGKVSEYIAKALKIAWTLVKKVKKVNGFEITEENFKSNLWVKYGHHRVYTEGYFIFNDHIYNAEKRVTFKTYFDFEKGRFCIMKGAARYENMIKEVIKNSVNDKVLEYDAQ